MAPQPRDVFRSRTRLIRPRKRSRCVCVCVCVCACVCVEGVDFCTVCRMVEGNPVI
jgi:hypothetical protein